MIEVVHKIEAQVVEHFVLFFHSRPFDMSYNAIHSLSSCYDSVYFYSYRDAWKIPQEAFEDDFFWDIFFLERNYNNAEKKNSMKHMHYPDVFQCWKHINSEFQLICSINI